MYISKSLNGFAEEFKCFTEAGIDPAVTRYGEVDIAYPTNEKEYCDLAGYAVMKVTAASDYAEELPIEKAYFQLSNGKVMPLEGLDVSVDDKPHFTNRVIEMKDDRDNAYFKSFSFWSIQALYFLDNDGYIVIDFKGDRKNFRILRGPWEIRSKIHEWLSKYKAGQLKIAKSASWNTLAQFVEREFC